MRSTYRALLGSDGYEVGTRTGRLAYIFLSPYTSVDFLGRGILES